MGNENIIKKELTWYSSPALLVKRKHQNLYRGCKDLWVFNNKLVKHNHTFSLVSGLHTSSMSKPSESNERRRITKWIWHIHISMRVKNILWNNPILWQFHIVLPETGHGSQCTTCNMGTVYRESFWKDIK